MEVSAEAHKIIKCTIYGTVFFFTSSGVVDDVLVRSSLITKIVKDVSLMCILFDFKHPQTFRES